MQEIRLRAFPIRENGFLTLIQETFLIFASIHIYFSMNQKNKSRKLLRAVSLNSKVINMTVYLINIIRICGQADGFFFY